LFSLKYSTKLWAVADPISLITIKSSIDAFNKSSKQENFLVKILDTLLPTNLMPKDVITLCNELDFDLLILSIKTLTDFSPNPSILSKSYL